MITGNDGSLDRPTVVQRSAADMRVDWGGDLGRAPARPCDPLGVLLAALPQPVAVFLGLTALLLMGYACFGRGFAYVGVPPMYVGDAILLVGVLVVLPAGRVVAPFGSPLVWLMAALGVWGAARTFPFVGEYGLDALRDGVVWGYAAYAIVCAACLLSLRTGLAVAIRWYARLAIPFILWVPVLWALARFAFDQLPRTPFSDVPFAYFKPGDTAVHLAGIAALWWLDLAGRRAAGPRPYLRAIGGWALWLVAVVFVSSESRSAALSVATALACVTILRPRSTRHVASMATAAVLVAVIAAIAGSVGAMSYFTPAYLETSRAISLSQIRENVASLFLDNNTRSGFLDETRQWRLDWWSEIAGYTLNGPYFWTGKGFGVNLADDDGFQTHSDEPLRSPHSIHMTFLARAGVPGLTLWILLQAVFAAVMARGAITAKHAGQEWWARVDIWLLAYWVAFLLNASFDVYLEGPQGAIWFWVLIGAGIAALQIQRDERFARRIYSMSLKSRRVSG